MKIMTSMIPLVEIARINQLADTRKTAPGSIGSRTDGGDI